MTSARGILTAISLVAAVWAAPALVAAQTVVPVRPDDRTLGTAAAPVTLTVYLSTTCGHCANWHNEDFPAIRAKYVDTGKMRVVFRDLLTAPGEVSAAGAMLVRCAPKDRFDEVMDSLFEGHRSQAQARPRDWLLAAGAAGGMTPQQVSACVQDQAGVDSISARSDASAADGVRGTPSFFIDGRPVPRTAARFDVAALDAVIQPLLASR